MESGGTYFCQFVLFHHFEDTKIQRAAVGPSSLSSEKKHLPQLEHFSWEVNKNREEDALRTKSIK